MNVKVAAVLLNCAFAAPAVAAPETYTIDTAHSFSHFEIQHLGLTWILGRFDKTTGAITLDRAAKQGAIEAQVDVATVSTGDPRRDNLLRSDEYFNVAKFPVMTYRATRFRFKDETPVGVDGELTLLGVTRPVSLDFASFNCIVHPSNRREICGTVARTTIKRSDFGMTRVSRSVGDEVRISINLEAIKG